MKKTEDPYKAMLMLFRNVGGKAGLQSTVQINWHYCKSTTRNKSAMEWYAT